MIDENELLFDELYEKTKDCGRIQFIKLLMEKERENKELKNQLEQCKAVADTNEELAEHYKNKIDKAIKHVSSLSSKGRDCMIYADVKKDILDILKEVK